MEYRRLGMLGGVFLVFCLLFTVPFYVNDISISQSRTTSYDRESKMVAAEAQAVGAGGAGNRGGGFPWTPVLTVLLLSICATGLSATVVRQLEAADTEVVSFQDEAGKALLDALSNDTCRQILAELEEDELAVSELAESLDMSIQRVQYNVDKLVDAGLVTSDKFKYSERGKEMDVYSLDRKYFVIGPS